MLLGHYKAAQRLAPTKSYEVAHYHIFNVLQATLLRRNFDEHKDSARKFQ